MSNCQVTFQGKTIPAGDFEYQLASNQIDLSPTSKSTLDEISILTLDLSTIPLLSPDKINSAQQEEMINWLTGEVINFSLNNAVKGVDEKELINNAFNDASELLKNGALQAVQLGIPVLEERINSILEVYDKLKEIVQIRVNNFGIDFEADAVTPEDATENYEEDKALKVNPYTKIGQEIKRQLFTIYDLDSLQEDGSYTEDDVKRTWFGFPAYKSINQVLPTILSHSKDLPAEFDVIKAKMLESRDANKWFVPLLDKLSEADGQVRNQFSRWASKAQINLKYLLFDTKTNEFQFNNSNSGRQVDIITNKWKNNLVQTELFKINPDTNEYELDREKADTITKNFEAFSEKYKMLKENYPEELFTELADILKSIGVDIKPREIKRMQKFLDTQGTKWGNTPRANFSQFFVADKGAVDFMIQRLYKADKEAEGSFNKYNPLSNNTGVRALTLLYSYYQEIATNDSYKNSNNDTIYAYSPKKYASDQFQRLLDTAYLGKLMETQFASNSTWGKALMSKDPDTRARFLEVFTLDYYDGATGKGSGMNTPFDQLSASEREKFLLTCFQNQNRKVQSKYRYGSTSYLTMSDKKTLISVQHILEDVDINPETNGLGNKSIDLLYQVFKAEQQRIREFEALTPENKKGLSKEYVKGAKEYILNPWVKQYKAEGKDLDSSEDVKKAIEKYYNDIIDAKIATWKEAGVVSIDNEDNITTTFDKEYFENVKNTKVGSKANINAAIAYAAIDYEVNTIIGNLNLFQLFAGDPASYWKNNVDDTLVNVGKRLAAQIAPGDSLANTRYTDIAGINGHNYTQVIAKDHKMVSSSIKYLTRLLDGKEVSDKEIEDYKAGSTKAVKEKYPNALAYFDIEATDAQEYTTALEHAYNLYHEGKLSDKVYKELADKLINDRELSDDDVKVLMQPMKPVYFNGDVKSAGTGSLNYYDMSYIKTSSFPLLKQFTVGTELDKLRKQLEKLQDPTGSKDPSQIKLVRMVMSSGIKIGAVQNPVTVFNSDGTVNSDIDFTESTKSLTRDGYRIQLEVPLKDKKEVNRGTQEIKLLFTDLLDHKFANGKTGQQLKTEYLNLNRQLFEAQLEIFKNQINVNEKGEFDIQLLRDKLVEEAQSRNFSLNEIESLRLVDLDSNGQFVIPLVFNSASDKFESLMISLIDNAVRKQKQTGYSSPLGSSSGFKFQNDLKGIDKSKIIWVEGFDPSGDLKQQRIVDGEVKGSQVFVPWKFRDNNGKLLNIKDFTKELPDGRVVIDHDKLPKDILKSFGFRIPTQGLNSMAYIEIAGFLPEETGDLLIAPAEFTKQMGSDFDIDKLYSYLYTTDFNYKTGKLEKFVFNNKDVFEILSSTNSSLVSKNNKDYRLKTLIKEFGYMKVAKSLFQFYNDKIDNLKKELDNKWSLHEAFVSNVLDTIDVKEASLDTNKTLINKAYRENEIYVAFLRDELSELRSVISALEKNELDEGVNEYLVDKFDIYVDEVRTESINELLRKEFELNNRLEKSVVIKESLKKFNASISDTVKVALDIKNDIFETKRDLRNILKYTSTLKNEILDMHITVLSDPSDLVQSKITSALGFGKLGSLKDKYDEAKSELVSLSPLSSGYQAQKYLSARGGKAGTGYFSSLNVFVSVMQGLGLKYNVSTPISDGKFAMVEKNLVIHKKGNGLSKNVDNTGNLKSENAVAFQSAAVDDEKEQIMASLNITSETFYAIGAWILDGHSQEAIVSILKQPIVAEYINAINNKTDIFSGYTKNADLIVFNELYEKYSKMTGLSEQILNDTDFNNTVLSEDVLWDSFKTTKKDANWAMTQLTALHKFREADSVGKSIQKTISAFNVDSKGLGKSFIEIGLKLDDIKTERESGKISNIEKLVNESIGGLAVQYSLKTVNKLFGKFYPYLVSESYNKFTFDEYLKITFKENLTAAQREKEFREFYNHMKAGVYANMLQQSGIDLYARRKELMYGENSLGKRIQELQKTTKNPFLIKLTPNVATVVGDPDTVSMRSIGGELFSEDDLYSGFLDLFNKPENRQLAKDLVDYFYINGGSQKAREFSKYIPTGFMVASGYADTLRSANLANLSNILGSPEMFLQNYIRNNPSKAPQLNKGDYKMDSSGRVTVTSDQFTYMSREGISTAIPYVSIPDVRLNPDGSSKVTIRLYMYDDQGSYVEIPRLGFTTSNYSGTEYGSKYSAIDSNAVKQRVQNPNTVQEPVRQEASSEPVIPNTIKVPANDFEALNLNKVNSKEDVKVTLSIINNSTSKALLELLDKINTLTLEVTPGNSSYKGGKITIDSRIKDPFVLQTKVLHEVTHAVTSEIINKILQDPNNPNFEGLSESQKLAYIRLNKTFTTLRQSVIDGRVPGLNKEGLAIFEAKIDALKKGQKGIDFTPDDVEYNPYINLKEFLAEAFSNTTFQKQLDAMKFNEDKSMLQKLLEDIANFLNKFASDYNKDNVLASVLYDGFTLAGGNEVNIYFKNNENKILSNLDIRPFKGKDGRDYASVEHAYQSWKSGSFDEATYTSPNWVFHGGDKYKVAGNKGTKTENNWNLDLMKGLIRQSLDQNPAAKQALLNTGDKLLTHNQDKTIWNTAFPQILMELRKEYYDAGLSGVNNVQVISPDYGVVKVETNPTKEETQKFINLIAPQIERQAYKENVGTNANWQFSFGHMWSRVNLKAKPLLINSYAGVSKTKAQMEALKLAGKDVDKSKYIYDYHELDQDGNITPPLDVLQPIIDKIQESLGIDMSDYDSVLGNIYLDNQSIAPHRDTTESKSAEGYPVVVYTIGNNSSLGIWDDNKGKMTFQGAYKPDFQGRKPTNEIDTKNGTIYTFGMDGKGRFALSHTTPLGNIKKNSFPPITLSDGRVITNYTITLTFRRAADLKPGMPTKPNKFNATSKTQPVETSTEEIQENLAEPTPQPQKSTFTYKNKTIETEFKLTNGQVNAIEKLTDFALGNTKTITLQGAAGTGKTSVIGYLQKFLGDNYNFIYMAPTHAATAELATATVKSGNRDLPMTVQSAFNKRKNQDTGEWEYGTTKKLNNKLEYSDNIIVIDEVSMLADKDYNIILDAIKNKQIQVIFMGDILQIPEVDTSNPERKSVSKAFSANEQVLLTEVKRTDDNDILTVLTELRNNPTSLIPVVLNTPRLQYLDQGEFDNQIVETIRKESEETVLLSYTNNGVKDSNRKLRRALGRVGNLQENDIIVGFSGYKSKQIEKGNIANSVRYTVESVEKEGSNYIITAKSQKLKALEELGVKNVHEYAVGTYKQLSINDSLVFEDLTNEDLEKNNRDVSEILKAVYDTKQAAVARRIRWNIYEAALAKASMYFENVNLGSDYVYNPNTNKMELYNYIVHGELLKNFAELKVEKGIDYGHAITIHKSQGSTIKNVFFDASTLPQGTSSKLIQNGNQISTEKHSLIYVALSRASNMLVINKSNVSNFYTLNKDSRNTTDNSISLPKDLGMDNLEFMKDLDKQERFAYRKLLNDGTFKVKCNG